MLSLLDLEALERARLETEPYEHIVVPRFVRPEALAPIQATFPEIRGTGSYPVRSLRFGAAFAAFAEELRSPELRALFGEKFGLDLSAAPPMLTVRGMTSAKDGQIHADSRTKLVTVLIYLNSEWTSPGGRLRLLRSADDVEDMAVEVPPVDGNLVAFKVGPNSWHGHPPAEGVRRSVQLNWVTDEGVVRREERRHRLSAAVKGLFG